jgi:hypothetical protein
MSKQIIKTLLLNTSFRDAGTISRPIFLPKSDLSDIEGIRLRSVRLPLSVYNINESNNIIYKNEASVLYTVSLSVGNYTSSNFPTLLKNALNSSGQQAYGCTFNTLNNLMTITNSSGNFKFDYILNNIYKELGFSDVSLLFQSGSQVSQAQIDLSGIQEINILSNIDCIDVVNKNVNILGNIPIDGSLLSIYNWNNSSDIFTQCKNKNISEITLELKDQEFRSLNQLLDWSISVDLLFEKS